MKEKKNLLLFTGHLRSIENIIDYHKKFIKSHDCDLLISTWNDDSELILLVKKKLNPILFDIENFDKNLTNSIFGEENKFDFVFGNSALSTRSQIYKLIRSYKLITDLEKKNNKNYDIIIKSRPDFLIYSGINKSIDQSTIYFENTVGNWAIDRSDRFFYSSRNQFLNFLKVMPEVAKKAWENNKTYPIFHKLPLQEMFIKKCIDFKNINSNPIFPISKIWREDRSPNLKDFIKIFSYTMKRFIKRKIFRFVS